MCTAFSVIALECKELAGRATKWATKMNYARRLSALQEVMREQNADLAVFGLGQTFLYLTGMPIDWRLPQDSLPTGCDLLVPQEGRPVVTATDAPDLEAPWQLDSPKLGCTYEDFVKSTIADLAVDARRVGVGGNLRGPCLVALSAAAPKAEIVDASRWLDRTRMIKEAEEIDRLRSVAQLTDRVMEKVVPRISAGLSQNELMLDIEVEARRQGATNMSFSPFAGYMKSGSGASEHIANVQPDQGLEPDTAICFDIGFVLDGYASDWGRSVFWGKPPVDTAQAHKALREAVLEVVGTMRDGSMRACDVYPAIEKALDDRGYGDQMRRRLAEHRGIGHSIGIEVHEHPWLGYTCEETLRENMVIAIEPKLWHPGEYYLRLEELVLIGKGGAEFLTNFDRELFVL